MGKIDTTTLNEICVTSVLDALGVAQMRGFIHCLWHEPDRHPSCHVDTKHNRVKCFSCGEGGDNIRIVQTVLGVSFREACEWLDKTLLNGCHTPVTRLAEAGNPATVKTFDASRYIRHFEKPILLPEANHFLFSERRLKPEVVSWARLNSWRDKAGVAWLEIPYWADIKASKLAGVQQRRLTPSETAPRFRYPSGFEPHVYGLPALQGMQPDETLWIAEGVSDTLSYWSRGVRAVGIGSATLLRPEDFLVLKHLGILHWAMYPDNDDAGRGLRDKMLNCANELGACLDIHTLPEGIKDVSELYIKVA